VKNVRKWPSLFDSCVLVPIDSGEM